MQEIALFEFFHNHPTKPRKEVDKKESSQAKKTKPSQANK
jgi:hypothetical protein